MRALIRVSAAAVVALAVALVAAAPALGVASGGAWTNGEDVGAGARAGGEGQGGRAGGTGAVTCRSERLTEEEALVVVDMVAIGLVAPGEGEGAWYRRRCTTEDGTVVSAEIVWRPAAVSAVALAGDAWDVSRIPLPDINLNPGEGRDQVVNVPTWMWLAEWAPVSASASAGAVTASPSHVEWDMGDGSVVTCDGPGTRYDERRPAADQSTDCSHTYTRSSASQADRRFPIEATSFWHVTWVSSTGESGDLGVVGRTSSLRVRVAEIQAVNG